MKDLIKETIETLLGGVFPQRTFAQINNLVVKLDNYVKAIEQRETQDKENKTVAEKVVGKPVQPVIKPVAKTLNPTKNKLEPKINPKK